MEEENGRRERTGEIVVVEDEGFEVEELGEVGERSGERVVSETQDSELVEAREGVRGEGSSEAGAAEDEPDDAVLDALDALPLAVVEAVGGGIEEGVVQVGFGLE